MDYQEIKNKAMRIAKDVKKTSENLYDSAKISVKISKAESGIEDKFIEIGRLIYAAHTGHETNGSKVSELCNEIDSIKSEIEALKAQKDTLKGGKKCGVCGCPVHPNQDTCPNCGCEL